MPKIIEQPRWAFWKYREVYQVEVAGEVERVREHAFAFFRSTGVKDFTTEFDGFRFRRNCNWRGVFAMSDRKSRHEISVAMQQERSLVLVTIEYRNVYPSIHFLSSDFVKEVIRLEAWLHQMTNSHFRQDHYVIEKPKERRRHLPVNFSLRLLYRAYRVITWSTYWTKRRYTLPGQAMLGGVLVALTIALGG